MRYFGHSQNSNNLQLNWNDCLAMWDQAKAFFPSHCIHCFRGICAKNQKTFRKETFSFFFRPLFFQSLPTDDKDIKFFIVH